MGLTGPLPENLLRCMPKEDRKPMGRAGRTVEEVRTKDIARQEKLLQSQVAAFLGHRGAAFTRSRMDRRTTTKVGTPDFIGCYRGRGFAIECKAGERTATKEQWEQLMRWSNAGAAILVAWSLMEVKAMLDEIDSTTKGNE